MTRHSGYLLEVLRSDGDFTLFRRRNAGEVPVLALTASGRPASPQSEERLAREFAFAAELDPLWAARPLTLSRDDGGLTLLLEDFGGEPLDRLVERAPRRRLELTRCLQVGCDIASALGQVHRRGLIHKDLKPANVLVDAAGHVRLTGFGIASRLPGERQAPEPPEVISGTFAYMAPEQTGRMNRSIDARSDLYSLGVTLYELLTGTLPFTASTPTEWIHCHIARTPVPPGERVAGLPPMVDAIVMRLLAKDAADRYQTAAGVEADLRRCLTAWVAHGRIDAFNLGERDVPDRLLMPETLYGRETEIDALRAAFERVLTQGTTELALVSGYAGIGKSSVVHELRVSAAARCLFAAGKFDQYQRDIPYATLAQALRSLTRQLLGKSESELAHWRKELLEALGSNGQLMVTLVPELALVIGEQLPTAPVAPQDAQARFQAVFAKLLGVFARPEHPLVLFLDDLQWLDTGTLELLERLVARAEVPHLLLIGAYRDNEVGPAHPLARTMAAIRDAGGSVSHIEVAPLETGHLARLAADALHTDVSRVYPLAELLYEKTGGNPFFAIQFVTALGEEGLLTFEPSSSAWRWDVERIRAKGITDNVADLMAAKLNRLPASTRETLGQLACLGNVAQARTLAALRGTSEDEVNASLRSAVQAGLIRPMHGAFSFTHDRVHEACYAAMAPGTRTSQHLQIGRVLLSLTPRLELEENVFEIVNQFDRGAAAINDLAERDLVADLNLMAGKRAKTSGAYSSAQAYFAAGRAVQDEASWDRRYRLTLDLELQRAECEIVNGELVAAEERLAALSARATGLADQADVVCLAVLLYFTTGRSERAVEVSLDFLSRVGITWSARPTEAEVRDEYLLMRRKLDERPVRELVNLPMMRDPACIATMAVLTELFPAAYAVDRYLMELVLLRMTNLSLEHGHSEGSSVAYSGLNMALGSHFSDYTTAYSLGQLACALVDRRGADRYKARVYSLFAAFTMPWIQHVRECRAMMVEAFHVGSSMGDMAFAAYDLRNLITHLLMSGVPLAEAQQEAERAIAFASRIQLGLPAERFFEQLDLIRRLRGDDIDRPVGDDEWGNQDLEGRPQLAMMVCYHWVFRLHERFFARDFAAALDAAARVEPIRWAMRSSIEEAEYDFYAALSHAAAASGSASADEREMHRRALDAHYQRIALWSEHCPENFANGKALVAAEISRLADAELEAQRLYEDAVQLSRVHGFLQNEALANELAGRFYEARGIATIADAYLGNARDCYERWGSLAKVRQLDAQFPQLRARAATASSASSASAAVIDAPVARLDAEAVDRASQTLSSEMVLPSLLEKLMRVAIEHAGAERGLLILLHGDEPQIEAKATTKRGSVEVVVRRTSISPSDLPQSTLQYVLRTRERVVLDDGSADGLDRDDEYVSRNEPRSVLCLPIFKEGQVIGALYLENNLTTRAFTSDRVAVLDFLASQAAIWLENARLYSDLRRSETWLREAQHLSLTGSFYWRVASDTLEFSEQTFRTYGLEPTERVTLSLIADRAHPEDRSLFQEMMDRARVAPVDLDFMYRAQLSDLSIKYLHVVAHGTVDREGQLEYIGAIQDVTQRRLSEEALDRARAELTHGARVMSLGALTASIAHEVNQPLSSIVMNAGACLRMLSSEPPNVDGARENARRMIRDGTRASEVIARLRALFSKRDQVAEPVDLNEAVREVIALSATELQQARVTLRTELSDNLPLVVGDRVQLQQVILNLMLNAAESMSSVENRARRLVITTAKEDGEQVRLSVQDSGAGLLVESPEKLFDAFYTTKSDGMGVGLSVSRSIIERHEGRLWAAPNDGPGATFAFSLPRAPEHLSNTERQVHAGNVA
jgi:predicted ATPase/signal transduction histidine kinase